VRPEPLPAHARRQHEVDLPTRAEAVQDARQRAKTVCAFPYLRSDHVEASVWQVVAGLGPDGDGPWTAWWRSSSARNSSGRRRKRPPCGSAWTWRSRPLKGADMKRLRESVAALLKDGNLSVEDRRSAAPLLAAGGVSVSHGGLVEVKLKIPLRAKRPFFQVRRL